MRMAHCSSASGGLVLGNRSYDKKPIRLPGQPFANTSDVTSMVQIV